MQPLYKIFEYNFLYGARLATAYELGQGVKIIGFEERDSFEVRVLSIGKNPKRTGLGKKALQFLRSKFNKITVSEIYEGALPFWLKMMECGLVDELLSIKDGSSIYRLVETNIDRMQDDSNNGLLVHEI
ncbi:hypothetical protein Psch_00945 [Pelotomaculum schinkii]|uniref:N-acetyltransferase domain-containing protein n=1 Tax=Pelotomaculum schinkii TaxID=78350 RepID=A0A4Y7REI1_9FIRM|nr:hypothetical protein [Pelotomaculum schinkii]TEB07394.1 hypothetical protein Psch_00945 [Pelotomaculum schinkii]